MIRKILVSCIFVAGLWLNSHGTALAYDSYRGHREYGYNAYRQNPGGEYDIYSKEQPERPARRDAKADFVGVIGVVLVIGVFWLMRRSSGGSSSRWGGGGGGYSDYSARYSSPRENSPSYSSHSDPSAGHFWGNPQDGTNVKSLWGTTKEE